MTSTTTALVLLNVQRHHLEGRADERLLTRLWQTRVEAARGAGHLVVHVQWDGEEGTPGATFSRGWVLHPDFRSEAPDLRVRVPLSGAFPGPLDAQLRERGVGELHLLALPGARERGTTADLARALGYGVTVLEDPAQPEQPELAVTSLWPGTQPLGA